jgi:hypothetical protein
VGRGGFQMKKRIAKKMNKKKNKELEKFLCDFFDIMCGEYEK